MGQTLPTQRMVTIPSRIWCFPYFSDENELLLNANRACISLRQFRGVVGCITNVLSPPTSGQTATNRLFTSATRYLLQYLLDRVCNQMLASGEERFQAICNNPASVFTSGHTTTDTSNNNNKVEEQRGNHYQSPSSSTSSNDVYSKNNPQQLPSVGFGTLEEALIQVKIEKAIANSAVAELFAKLVAVENRYGRLVLNTIPLDDRRLEVVPALSLCEEILQLFRDPGHIFMNQPLISAPFVVTFGAIYAAVAELSLAMIPSYSIPLVRQMLTLKQILIHYKLVCIEVRVRSLMVKPISGSDSNSMKGGSMMDGAFSGMTSNSERYLYVDDKFSKCYPTTSSNNASGCSGEEKSGKCITNNDLESSEVADRVESFTSEEEALSTYRKALEDKYDSFFDEVLNVISSFSGFEEISDSSTSKLDHQNQN